MNQVQLMGNVTKDIELRESAAGMKYVQFTLAVNSSHAKDTTNFIDIVAFDKQAELLSQYVNKGRKIGVEGYLNQSQYIDKDGNKKNSLKVVLTHLEFIDRKKDLVTPEEEIAVSKE